MSGSNSSFALPSPCWIELRIRVNSLMRAIPAHRGLLALVAWHVSDYIFLLFWLHAKPTGILSAAHEVTRLILRTRSLGKKLSKNSADSEPQANAITGSCMFGPKSSLKSWTHKELTS